MKTETQNKISSTVTQITDYIKETTENYTDCRELNDLLS